MSGGVQRVGIDIRYLSHGLIGGVHTYVRRLLPALLSAGSDIEFVLYADRKAPLDWEPPAGTTLHWLSWRNELSSVANDLTLARRMAADRIDVSHHPANYGFAPRGGRAVVTIHDALNLQPVREGLRGFGNARGLRTPVMVAYLSMMSRAAVTRASELITISSHSRREIAARGGVPEAKITVTPLGAPFTEAELPGAQECDRVLTSLGVAPGFILGDALKNPGVLVDAWHRLTPDVRRAHPLLFFSRREDLIPALQDAVQRGDARVLVRPDTTTVRALYRRASAFAFPSWIEGFGLPLLEAMTAGVPIIASDRGAIPEVAGDAAILCDAEDAAGFASGLTRILSDAVERERLVANGRTRVATFTWERTARETIAVYQRVFARSRSERGVR